MVYVLLSEIGPNNSSFSSGESRCDQGGVEVCSISVVSDRTIRGDVQRMRKKEKNRVRHASTALIYYAA